MLKKQSSSDVTEYAPIAKALHTFDSDAEGKLKHKFDIAFFISKENVAFAKMGVLCDLEERHGVACGSKYNTRKSSSSTLPASVLPSACKLKNLTPASP